MSETMSNVERGLWRIAELGARCSQQSAAGSRGPLWAELEQTIANLEAEFEAAGQAVDIAPAQVRSLEGRLNVAKKERDRERVRAEECFADAEAARRERDRERARAAKAVAAATEAKAAATEAKAAAADCVARATAAQAALDQALSAQHDAVAVADEAVTARDRAVNALDDTKAALDATESALDQAMARIAALEAALEALSDTKAALDQAKARVAALEADREALGDTAAALDEAEARVAALEADLDAVRAERDALAACRAADTAERADALDTLAARAEGAVVVLPGMALPEAELGPIAPAARVSWRPAWSEWAGDTAEVDEANKPGAAPVPGALDGADDIVLDSDSGSRGVRRYLNVAATIGQLLPEDLGPLLLSGATVLRREGRLFATVAITADPWATPGSDGAEQAKKLADAGFRVEWTSDAPLAC